MIIVSGTITLDPEDREKALAGIGPLVEATLAEEGNITYGFWEHPTEPGLYRVYEEWADEDALNAHMVAPHFIEFIGVMGSLRILGTDVNRHDVTDSRKVM